MLEDSGLGFILFFSLLFYFNLIFCFYFYLRDSNIMSYIIVIMIISLVTYVMVTISYDIEDSRIMILYSIITIYWS